MFVTYILSQIRAYLRYRETVRELSQLGDRELNDLGIVRYEFTPSRALRLLQPNPLQRRRRCSARPPAGFRMTGAREKDQNPEALFLQNHAWALRDSKPD